jgi:hypothetical protein
LDSALIDKNGIGFGTFGVYPEACWLVGNQPSEWDAGPDAMVFVVTEPWSMRMYGAGRAEIKVDGVTQSLVAEGGGTTAYETGPFPPGVIRVRTLDGGSTKVTGGGGTSSCTRSIVVAAHVEPTPTPTAVPSAEPTPAPTQDTRPVALSDADRARLDLLTFTVAVAGGVGAFAGGGLLIASAMRRRS